MVSTSFVQSAEIAVLRFSNPPVNALSIGDGLIAGLSTALQRALRDDGIQAIVITADGKLFSGGADIKDFDADLALLDQLRTMVDAIEASPKPVVIALNGATLGGGLEVAIAGHYRVAVGGILLGLPEVTLGLLPGGGGTQRLPRLIGTDRALDMMVTGKTIDTDTALEWGLIDKIVEGDLISEACAFARSKLQSPPRRTQELKLEGAAPPSAELKASRAVKAIVECVQGAHRLPFDGGLLLEKRLFEELARSEESAGLRHVFFSRRKAGEVAGLKSQSPGLRIRSVAVIGGGLMGSGIANAVINADLPVVLVEPKDDARARAVEGIGKALQRDVDKKRLSREAADRRQSLLTATANVADIADADLVIEAVFEDFEVKRSVLGDMDRHAKAGAVLASNTSTLDLDLLATATLRPDHVLGLHFFSPANIMKLVEVVRGEQTALPVLDAGMRFAKAIGKIPVVSGVCDGFIGNRMFEEYLRQAYFLLEEGALPAQVDAALEKWGMAMGPLKVMDLAGQDIGWKIRQRRKIEQPDRPYSEIPDLICKMGRFGQKTGAGYYRYEGRTAVPDPEIDALIETSSKRQGIQRRTISDQEIVERCIFALVNEGAKILEEGVAQRSSDIDTVYVFGYGFPAERGGPMFYADRRGLDYVLERIRTFEKQRHGWAWRPADLLVERAKAGSRIDALEPA